MSILSHILFRADAGAAIGHGHVMRCFALAEALVEADVAVTFASCGCSDGLESRLTDAGVGLISLDIDAGSADDADATIRAAKEVKADWVVVDGYHFGYEYQQVIRRADLRLMLIDDHGHLKAYTADLLLNQNVSATEALYPRCDAQLLLGSEYVMLRQMFRKLNIARRGLSDSVEHVLVTTGGSDPHNTSPMIIDALAECETRDIEVVVVAGNSNPHIDALEAHAKASGLRIEVKRGVSDMASLMAWADLAITGAGSTCWELAYMGVPMVTVVLADNQQPIAEAMDYRGAACNVGWHETLTASDLSATVDELAADRDARLDMIEAGRALVDGCGAARVIERMASFVPQAQRSA